MTANASTLSSANFETTLPVDAMVSVCLSTATQVCPGGGTTTSSSDASLSALALAESGAAAISLGETFVPATLTYTASVANEIDTVTLTATKNDSNATVVIASDDDTGTKGVAELDLDVGSNTLTVTVTAQDGDHRAGIHDYGHAGDDGGRGLVHDHHGGGNHGHRQGVPHKRIQPVWWLVGHRFLQDRGCHLQCAATGRGRLGRWGDFPAGWRLSSYADYTLEFAGETLPLTGASSINPTNSYFFFDDAWLAANAPSLSIANYRTTLPVDARVSACLRTTTQVCPRGTITTTNTAATGTPGISGTAAVGQTLTATTSGISDADGKTKAENGDAGYAYAYQWVRVDGNTETDITGETSSTYTPVAADVDQKIKVKVSFTDDAGNPEGPLPSDAVATGTIENTDAMPRAWMVRFGRTVGTQVVDALTQRLDGAGGSHVTVAGINLIGAKGEEPTLTDDDPFGLPEWAKNAEREADAQSITADDLLLRSAFHLSSGGNAMQQGGGRLHHVGAGRERGVQGRRGRRDDGWRRDHRARRIRRRVGAGARRDHALAQQR